MSTAHPLPPASLDDTLFWLKGDALQFTGAKLTESRRLFVQRPDDSLRRLRQQLLRLEEPLKYLVAGHRGTGKSTEINRLLGDETIASRFRVVSLSAKESLDLYQLGRNADGHIDILLAIAGEIHLKVVVPDKLPLPEDSVRDLVSLCRRVEEKVLEKAYGAEVEVEAGAGVPRLTAFFASFRTRLRSESKTSAVLREVIAPDMGQFLQALDKYVHSVQDALLAKGNQARLLVVVEDLDKIPTVEAALAIFRDGGTFLARPPFAAIYTMPAALAYSTELAVIRGPFTDCISLSALRSRQQVESEDGSVEFKPFAEGRLVLKEFLRIRVGQTFSDEAIDRCCEYSGGVFSQLQRLAEASALEALARGAEIAGQEDADAAIIHLRAELDRPLSSIEDGMEVLDRVDRENKLGGDKHLWLLHNLHVLEYLNHNRWCDVNPLLRLPLQRWRRQSGKAKRG